jgi:hypothetical protein
MNKPLVHDLALKAGWTPVPGALFGNSLQEMYNHKLVHLVLLEVYEWARENGGLNSPEDLADLLEHFLETHHE